MTCNIGNRDRILRMGAGIASIGAGLFFHSWFALAGVVLLLTGLFRFCPAYVPLGIHTK